MTKLIVILTLLGAGTMAWPQQDVARFHTNPKLPSRDALDRLDLVMAWKTRQTLDGLHDGYYTLQLIPGPSFPLLLAQTFRGDIIAMNAETGDTLWRTPAVLRYKQMGQPGYNHKTIFTNANATLFALDRQTGKQLLYTSLPGPGILPEFGFDLDAIPLAAMTATDDALFITFGNRVIAVAVPDLRHGLKLDPKDFELAQPFRLWTFTSSNTVMQPPLVFLDTVVLIGDGGTVLFLDKKKGEVLTAFKTEGDIAAAAAANKSMVYLPGMDYYLYALDVATGRLAWRFAGQAPIIEKPTATNADVFVPVSKGGLYRLDPATGEVKWSNNEAVKFLAVNRQFVYAMDRVGNTLVLDYLRGKTLAVWNTRDWIVSIANDMTDRIYLASHDGQIICLRHRENATPLKLRSFEEEKPKSKGDEPKVADKTPKVDDKIIKDQAAWQRPASNAWSTSRSTTMTKAALSGH